MTFTRTITRLAATAAVGMALLSASALAEDDKAPAANKPTTNAIGADPGWEAKIAPTQPGPPTTSIELDEAQTKLVQKVSAYFNDLTSLKGSFVQTGADNKRLKGKFYVQRPGRFRFDYALPSKQVIISDGITLAIQDHDLKNEDRMELNSTPFRLVMRKNVDLLRDAKIREVREADGKAVVTLEDKDPDTPGRIKLTLATVPTLQLEEWVTTDPQGLDTRVEISELVRGDQLAADLFTIKAPATDNLP